MNRTFRNGLMLMAALALIGTPSAWAACPFTSQQIWNGLGGFITNCPDAQPVIAYTYSMSAPTTINSAAQAVACNDASVTLPTFLPCQPEAGTPGDGNVTIYYEWGEGNIGSVGCPNPDQAGEDPVALQLVCNNGAGVLLTIGFYDTAQQYIIELASPGADGGVVTANFDNGPQVVSVNDAGTAWQVNARLPVPATISDCNPGSFAEVNGVNLCTVARPAYTRGRLYVREAACGSSPDPRLASGWNLLPGTIDGTGAATNVINKPTALGSCAFVGATATMGAVETAAVVGSFQVTPNAAANDKVKIDNAAFAQGKLVVAFSTTNETSIVGFNVYTGATKLNGSLITAKGAGSNAYAFEIGRGALKGGKSVLVEAVKSDGTVEKTAPVALKQ